MTQTILIVGAGFAGMWSALGAMRLLDKHGQSEQIEVLLLAPEPELHLRPRLYEDHVEAMKAPLTDLLDVVGVRFIRGYAFDIESTEQVVMYLDDQGKEKEICYDALVLATGSQLFRPAVAGLKEYGFSVDQLDEAVALQSHLKSLANEPDTAARNTIMIVGGGFTGIETAAEMPSRLRSIIGADAKVRVIIIEQADAIGPDLGMGPRPVITSALTEMGVEWKLATSVVSVDSQGVVLSTGERVESRTVIWTGGMRASSLALSLPGVHDALGRLHVDDNLKVSGVENVFASGDVALAATDDEGHFALMSCQHALILGRFSGYNVAAALLGVPTISYRQTRYVTCLDLGPWGAVYTEGWDREVKMVGAEAKALKHMINSEWIYPPAAIRKTAFEAADPHQMVVA